MYVCEICKRIWKDNDASDNEYCCVKKCGGRLVPQKEPESTADDLINRLPFPVAYPWYMSLNESLEPIKRVQIMVFTAYQAMRTVSLVLLSDYLETPGNCPSLGRHLTCMGMPHWGEWIALTHKLAKYLTGRNKRSEPEGTPLFLELAFAWLDLKRAWKQSPLSARLTPDAVSSIDMLQKLRNSRAHNQGVLDVDGEESEVLDSYLPVLEHMLNVLFSNVSLSLVRGHVSGTGKSEVFRKTLEDPKAEEIELMRLAGPHPDFSFQLDSFQLERMPLDDPLRQAISVSSIAVVSCGKTLPVYPFFLVLDKETDLVSGMVEPVAMMDSFSEKKMAHSGVKWNGVDSGLGAVVTERLARKRHELGLTAEKSSPLLMVEWARDNARSTLDNLTMTKYFPQCYVARREDRLLAETAGSYSGPVVIAGEAGSGKSSLLCAMVTSLIRESESDEDADKRTRLYQKKVRGKLKTDGRAMDSFFSLKSAGDVVVFLSGPKAVTPDADESMERAFCRALLNACGVMPSEFDIAESFMKQINKSMKDEVLDRKIWIVLDAVNESDRFRDLAAVIDRFATQTHRYPWLRLIVTMRAGALDALHAAHKAKLAHGPAPFSDENVYTVFENEYESGPREEPRLTLPKFTADETRTAYETRREMLLERACKTPWEKLPPRVAGLLSSPLYLHIFHETWTGVEAELTLPLSESTLFEAYLNSLEKELSGMGSVLENIGDDLYKEETSGWTQEHVDDCTEAWRKEMHLDSIMYVCTLSPVEMLVSASLLMRPADDDSGYQFSHQKICEQVLKRRMLKDWDRAEKTEEGVADVFTGWLEKSERFDWISNATADIFGGWTGKQELRFLPVLAGIDIKADNAFKNVFKSVLLAQCRRKKPEDIINVFIKRSFSNDRCFQPLLNALSESYHLATTTGNTMGIFHLLVMAVPALEQKGGQHPKKNIFQGELSVFFDNLGRIHQTLGEGQKALEYYGKSLQIMLGLVEKEPNRTDFQGLLSVYFNNVGRIHETLGESQKALEYYEKALQITLGLVEKEPNRTDFQRELGLSFNNVGHIHETLGEGQKALEYYENSLQIMLGRVEKEPNRTDFQRELSISFNNAGYTHELLGECQKALEYYEKALQITLGVVGKEPNRTDFQRELGVSFNNVGRIHETLGEGQKALEYYENFLHVMLGRVEKEPNRTDFQRELSISFNNVGRIHKNLGEGQKALEYYQNSLQIMLKLVEKEPNNTDFQRELSVSFNNVGETLGEGKKALKYYEESLQIILRLVEKEPNNTDFQRELSISFKNVGGIHENLGEGQKALEYYENSLQIMLGLVEKEPNRTDFQRLLSLSFNNVGGIHENLGEGQKALKYYEQDLHIMLWLVEKEPSRTDFQQELSLSFNDAGHINETLGEGQKALEYYGKSLQIMLGLVEKEPNRTDFLIDYATSHWNIYLVCQKKEERFWLEKAYGILVSMRDAGKTHYQLDPLLEMVQKAMAELPPASS